MAPGGQPEFALKIQTPCRLEKQGSGGCSRPPDLPIFGLFWMDSELSIDFFALKIHTETLFFIKSYILIRCLIQSYDQHKWPDKLCQILTLEKSHENVTLGDHQATGLHLLLGQLQSNAPRSGNKLLPWQGSLHIQARLLQHSSNPQVLVGVTCVLPSATTFQGAAKSTRQFSKNQILKKAVN